MGVIFGVRGTYAYNEPGSPWSKVRLDAGVRLSTKLVQRHTIELALRDVFGFQEILNFDFEYNHDPVFPYFGIAHNVQIERDMVNRSYNRMTATTVGSSIVYQHPILSRLTGFVPGDPEHRAYLRVFGGYRFRHDRFSASPGTRFSEEGRNRADAVRRASYVAGLAWDSRDDVVNTKWGALHDVSVEPAAAWSGASSTWLRLNASARFYRWLGTPKVVFAQQFLFDALIGDAPLLSMAEFGGLLPKEGIGGRFIGRGFLRRRFIGKIKAATSMELRVAPWSFTVAGRSLTPGVKLFVDGAKIVEPDRAPLDDVHVSGGVGPYFVWADFFVLRLDFAASPEGYGFYVNTGHAF